MFKNQGFTLNRSDCCPNYLRVGLMVWFTFNMRLKSAKAEMRALAILGCRIKIGIEFKYFSSKEAFNLE